MENMREDPLEVLAEELTRRVAERISAQIEEASRQRELLTLEGVREHLDVSKTTLWNFRNRGGCRNMRSAGRCTFSARKSTAGSGSSKGGIAWAAHCLQS